MSDERSSTIIPLRTPEQQRRADIAAAHPFSCEFCRRPFKSKGGRTLHGKRCSKNPAALMYTSGEYDPLLGADGRIVGFIWNGEDEHHRRRIRADYERAGSALGLPSLARGKSHREIVLGPDPQEQCARCPEMRRRHKDGPCNFPGCPCEGFVGINAQVAR